MPGSSTAAPFCETRLRVDEVPPPSSAARRLATPGASSDAMITGSTSKWAAVLAMSAVYRNSKKSQRGFPGCGSGHPTRKCPGRCRT